MRPHLTVLAALHLVLSAFGLATAAIILVSTVAAGAFVGMTDAPWGSGMLVGTIGTIVSVFFAALAVPGLALAYGLWKRRPWSRTLGIVIGVLDLFHFPFGTVLGVYTLWAMAQPETKALLEGDRAFA